MTLKYCIVRTYSAGVFAGIVDMDAIGEKMVVKDARRIWKWEGAATLSQLSLDGTSKPESCKFPAPVEAVHLMNVVEVIPCTEKAELSIKEVSVWSA